MSDKIGKEIVLSIRRAIVEELFKYELQTADEEKDKVYRILFCTAINQDFLDNLNLILEEKYPKK
jgi:hypothetical protein